MKAVFVICLLVFLFSIISIGTSVESANHQASGAGIDNIVNDGLNATFEDSIEQGISYLFSTRTDPNRKRGEFALFASSNRNMSGEVYGKINFGTPFVYHSLGFLENLSLNSSALNKSNIMRNDAISFMLLNKEVDNYDDQNVRGVDTGGAVWRHYYGSDIPKDNGQILPWGVPDIDNTVVILQALYENGEDVDDYYPATATDYFINYQLRDAIIIHNITVPPIQLRYNTFHIWIPEQNESEVFRIEQYDALVNANVLFFYSTQLPTSDLQDQIPEVFDYVNYGSDKMNENRQKIIFPGPHLPKIWAGSEQISIYYPSSFSFTHSVSRAYKEGCAPITGNHSIDINKIKEYILADDNNDGQLDRQETDGSWGNFELINGTKTLVTNDLETALATLSLLNIYDTLNTSDMVMTKTAIDKSIQYLLENQNPDGSWDSAFWFWAPPPTIYSGSAELTTGFVLEAIAKYLAIM